jgi:TRAP-type C4-dicarboxylate transport system permease small subunit
LTKTLTLLRSNRVLLSLLFFPLFAAQPALGSGFSQYSGPGVVVSYEPRMQNAAAAVAAMYPRVKADLEEKTGWSVNFTPGVVLIRENRLFLQSAGSELVTAYAVPGRDLIVIDFAKMDRTPFDLQATLEHELCHLLVHRMVSSDIPRWLDEGVAQWASGGIADIINPGEKDILRQAVISHTIIPLDALSAAFPSQPRDFILAYQESRSFIDFIVHGYGADKLRAVLHAMADHRTLPDALSAVLSVNIEALQEKWQARLLRTYSWPAYASDHIYWALFFAAALVTFIGYIRLIWRMKHYKDEEERDEPGSPEDGR